jgi:hypothetical protein
MLTADEVLAKDTTTDISALESLQRFRHGARDFYPADQFSSDGKMLPVYAEMLAILRKGPECTDWDLALWWINPTGWLSSFAPRDRLLETPDEVRLAAEQEYYTTSIDLRLVRYLPIEPVKTTVVHFD